MIGSRHMQWTEICLCLISLTFSSSAVGVEVMPSDTLTHRHAHKEDEPEQLCFWPVVLGVVTAELCQNEEGDGIMSKMVEDLDEVKWIFLILLLAH